MLLLMGLASCSKQAESNGTTFTLQTGVTVEAETPCAEGEPKESVSLKRSDKAYIVSIATMFRCDGEKINPALTVSRDKRVTLVLAQRAESHGFHSSCECPKTMKVRIENRLEPGDTLYILNDYEVIGHFQLDK